MYSVSDGAQHLHPGHRELYATHRRVYVDNMLIGSEPTDDGRSLKDSFIERFAKRFNIEIRGTPTRFLGMEIERTDDTLTLKQTSYISN